MEVSVQTDSPAAKSPEKKTLPKVHEIWWGQDFLWTFLRVEKYRIAVWIQTADSPGRSLFTIPVTLPHKQKVY